MQVIELGWISQRVKTTLIPSQEELIVLTQDQPYVSYISKDYKLGLGLTLCEIDP